MARAFDKVAVSEERFGRALVAFVALGFGLLIAAAVAVPPSRERMASRGVMTGVPSCTAP